MAEYNFTDANGNQSDDLNQLMQLARIALDRGYDPDKIYSVVRQGAAEAGLDWDNNAISQILPLNQDPIKKSLNENRISPTRAFKNAITPEIAWEANSVRNSPNAVYGTGQYDASTLENKDKPGLLSSFLNEAERGLTKAGQTAALATSAPWFLPDAIKEQYQKAAHKLGQAAEEIPQGRGPGALAGGLLSGAATLGLGGLSEGADVLEHGGSLEQALGAQAVSTAQAELALASGKLGSGLASRVATQGATGGLLGEAGRVARNQFVPDEMKQDFSLGELGANIGAGAVGGVFPNETKPRQTPKPTAEIPKTGDPVIDAGAKAFSAIPEQGDLFNQEPVTRDLFSNEIVPAKQEPSSTPPEPPVNVVNPDQQPLDLNQGDTQDTLPGLGAIRGEGISQWMLNKNGEPTPSTSPIKPRTERATREGLLAEMKAIRQQIKSPAMDAMAQDALAERNRLSTGLFNSYKEGKLTVGGMLDAIADNHENMLPDAPQVRALAGYLRDAAYRLGGDKVPIQKYNPEIHPESHVEEPELAANNAAGYYSPKYDGIRLHSEVPDIPLMMHESVHALTNNAIYLGADGKLPAAQQKAYVRLNSLFEQLKEHMDSTRSATEKRPYGLTNLDEFTAEFFARPSFRNGLKKISADSFGNSGFGRLAKAAVNNVYSKVVSAFRQVLGLPEKAETAMDTMFAAAKDFVDQLTPEQRAWEGATPSRMAQDNVSNLRTPDTPTGEDRYGFKSTAGQVRTKARGLAGAIAPEIRQAKERIKGENALSGIKAEQLLNSYDRAVKANPAAEGDLANHVNAVLADVLAPQAKTSIEEIKKINPELGQHVETFAKEAPEQRLKYAEQILSMPGDIPDHMLDLAGAIVRKAGTYQKSTYAINQLANYGTNLKANAKAAEKAIAAGQTPSREQASALKRVNDFKKYVKDFFLVSPDRAEQLSYSNLETAYKFYSNKELSEVEPLSKYADEDSARKARKAAAINLVKEQYANIHNMDEAVNHVVDKALSLTNDEADSVIKYFRNLRMPSNVFSTLQDVPSAVANLWGKDHSPIATMANSMMETSRINATLDALSGLRESGMGKLFTDKIGVPGYTETLTGEKMGPLQGLRTTPEIKDMIDSFIQGGNYMSTWNKILLGDRADMSTLGKAGYMAATGIRKIAGVRKALQIIGNPVARVMINLSGSGFQSISNGNFNPVHMLHGMKVMGELINSGGKGQLSELAQDAIRFHMAESSTLAEGYGPNTRKAIADFLNQAGAANPADAPARISKFFKDQFSNLKDASTVAKEFYGAADLWSKMANYIHELDFWKNHYGDSKPLEAIKQEVADRINNTNITPSRAWTAAKISDAAGLTVFAPYYAEVARTTLMNLSYAKQDMLRGAAEGNARLFAHGAKRLIGTGAAVGGASKLMAMGTKTLAAMLGASATQLDDNDARKKYLDTLDQFKGGEPILFKDHNGNEFVLDAAMVNPYDPISRPLLSAAKAMSGDGKAKQHIDDAIAEIVGMFNRSSMWAYANKEVTGAAPTWAKVNPQAYDAAQQWMHDNMGNLSVKDMNRVLNLATFGSPQLAEKLVRSFGMPEGIGRGLTQVGFPVGEVNPLKEITNYKGVVTGAAIAGAKDKYLSLLKANITADPVKLEANFKSGLKDVAKAYDDMGKAVQAAKAQGKTSEEIARAFELGKLPREVRVAMMTGKPIPAMSMVASLKDDAKRDYLMADSDVARKEVADRFSRNYKSIIDLFNKYKSKTVEEILNGE